MNRPVYIPTKNLYPCPQGVVGDPAKFGKLFNGGSPMFGGYHKVVGPIVRLLLGGSPPAVALGISTRVIEAVKGMSIRALSHIGKESRECHPLLTDCDPGVACRPCSTPAPHGQPNPERPGSSSAGGMSVLKVVPVLGPQAPAGLGRTRHELSSRDNGTPAAGTRTVPHIGNNGPLGYPPIE